jgi:predicted RNA-binding Zn-ribbon protein involved in translation (DUF1610 family)
METSVFVSSGSECSDIECTPRNRNLEKRPENSRIEEGELDQDSVIDQVAPRSLVGDHGLAEVYKNFGLWERESFDFDIDSTKGADGHFYCPKCTYRASIKSSLTKHYLSHAKPYVCKRCGKFRCCQLKDVVRHINAVHRSDFDTENIMNYTCKWCGKDFARKDNKTRHEQRCKGGNRFGPGPSQQIQTLNQVRFLPTSPNLVNDSELRKARDAQVNYIRTIGSQSSSHESDEEDSTPSRQITKEAIESSSHTIIGLNNQTRLQMMHRTLKVSLGDCDETIDLKLEVGGQELRVSQTVMTPTGYSVEFIAQLGTKHKINLIYPYHNRH